MKDGHVNKCKKCAKRESNEWRENNLEKIQEYDRFRYKNDMKRREDHNESTKKHREKYPEKYKARMYLGNAVRDRRIIKEPCCVCGNNISTAHHEDYSKPLEVVWVCLKHHKELE